jgi:putative transposase
MVKNGNLSKSISDASWGTFLNMLFFKEEEAGRKIVRVNPRSTSQICSSCNTIVQKSLSERVHNCPNCSFSIDRDLNAAINIHRFGLNLQRERENSLRILALKGEE